MSALTIKEIHDLSAKSVIPRVEGTLQAVFKTNRGTSAKGPYAIQTVILAQGDDEIRVGIFNGPNVDESMKGEEVAIMCSATPKGLSGVSASDVEYPKNSGEIHREIRMDRTARIMLLADAPKNGDNPPVAASTVANRAPVKSSAPAPDFKDYLSKAANVYHLARVRVEELTEAAKGVYTITEDQKHKLAESMLIVVDKKSAWGSVPTEELYLAKSNAKSETDDNPSA